MVTTEDKLGERARREERRVKRGLGEIESNKQQQQPSTQTHHTATTIDTHSLLSCVASWYVWVSKIDGIPSKGIQSINGPQGSGGPGGLVAEASASAVAEIGGAAQEEV